jgi:hypothetical protein
MKLRAALVPLLALAACSDGPTKEESARIWAATNTALSSAQSRAVADASANSPAAPGALALDFTGPCTLGGTVSISGSWDGSATGNTWQAAFDLSATFDNCQEAQGTLDGDMHWTSSAGGAGFSASLTGDLAWSDSGGNSASCAIDVQMNVSLAGYTSTGSVCGYDASATISP